VEIEGNAVLFHHLLFFCQSIYTCQNVLYYVFDILTGVVRFYDLLQHGWICGGLLTACHPGVLAAAKVANIATQKSM